MSKKSIKSRTLIGTVIGLCIGGLLAFIGYTLQFWPFVSKFETLGAYILYILTSPSLLIGMLFNIAQNTFNMFVLMGYIILYGFIGGFVGYSSMNKKKLLRAKIILITIFIFSGILANLGFVM